MKTDLLDSIAIPQIEELYERSRFLDAYKLTKSFWNRSTDLSRLSADQLILAGRFANRLGGGRLCRWLSHLAYQREPENPNVRYFTHRVQLRRRDFLDEIRHIDKEPLIGSPDPRTEAWWLAYQAVTWATLRDFSKAETCLARARSFLARDGWIECCESTVMGAADRWEESLSAAERSWEFSDAAPYAVNALGISLLNLGRVAEAATRITTRAENCQSYEIIHFASWLQCLLADRGEGHERQESLQLAKRLADRLPDFAPLADRNTRAQFIHSQFDIASLMDDHQTMKALADQIHSPYHRWVHQHLRRQTGGQRIRLRHLHLHQKHETCLPTSIASALLSQDIVLNPDSMASEVTLGGTPNWAAAEWLEKRGFTVRLFTVTEDAARKLIHAGIAFILCLESDDSAHAVAAVGLDESAETLLVHDPASFRTSEYLLSSLQEMAGPVEPRGMAIVPRAQTQLLDDLLPHANVEIITGSQNHQKALELSGVTAAAEVLNILAAKFPDDSAVQFLKAIQQSVEGRSGEALASFRKLHAIYPASPMVHRRLLNAANMMGNSALSRSVLRDVVEGALLPGIESRQNWRHPPSNYVCIYADLLRASAATRGKAKLLLRGVLVRTPTYAQAWHILGDLLADEGDDSGKLLCYRISSCLAEADEHHALTYCYALCRTGQKDEGFTNLERRARKAGPSRKAAYSWVSWIETLEHWGHPAKALAVCREALTVFTDAPGFLAHVIPFLCRMGLWSEAEKQMESLQTASNSGNFQEAARDFYAMKGEFEQAIFHARELIRESPLSLDVRTQLLELVARHEGEPAATELAAEWVREYPGHDDFEKLLCERLSVSGPSWKKDRLLQHRVQRNPEDGWAWRELASTVISHYKSAQDRRRSRLRPKIERYLAECDRTAPEGAATVRIHALWREACGDWPEAVDLWRAAVNLDPSSSTAFRRLWECSARLTSPERYNLFLEIEPKLLSYPSQLSFARDMGFLLAQRFGVAVAEDALKRWNNARADDPEVVRAHADMLLEHGQGRSDASRAKLLLQPAVERFPYHRGLRFSLAIACRMAGDHQEADEALQEILRRYPDETSAIVQAALGLDRRGLGEEASAVLDAAAARFPLDDRIWNARVRRHLKNSRFDAACSELHAGLQAAPYSVSRREQAIDIFLVAGASEEALAAAREGVRLYPTGAYMWLLLAKTLHAASTLARPGEIETCLRRGLSYNASLFEAADNLAILLMDQNRTREAEDLMQGILPRLEDPSPARGRLATIHRQAGHKADARNELASLVSDTPWYFWGWRVLLHWITEDSEWGLAKDLLRIVPPEILTNCDLRQQRLQLLSKAGMPPEQLRSEWESLVSDFPENLSLHLECYDYFQSSGAPADASRVLHKIQPFFPDNPFLLARSLELHAQNGELEKATEVLLRIWFQEIEQGTWPADQAWTLAHRFHFDQVAYLKAKARMVSGAKPTSKAFSLMAHEAMLKETKPKTAAKDFFGNILPGPGARELRKLLDLLDASNWASGPYRGLALGLLADHGYHRLVVRYWYKNKASIAREIECRAQTLRALYTLDRKDEARALFSNWREQNGVDLWMVTNYVNCFSRSDKRAWSGIRENCKDALAGLHHDHCAKYLAHILAATCAAQEDLNGFRETWNSYRYYFSGKCNQGEWFDGTT